MVAASKSNRLWTFEIPFDSNPSVCRLATARTVSSDSKCVRDCRFQIGIYEEKDAINLRKVCIMQWIIINIILAWNLDFRFHDSLSSLQIMVPHAQRTRSSGELKSTTVWNRKEKKWFPAVTYNRENGLSVIGRALSSEHTQARNKKSLCHRIDVIIAKEIMEVKKIDWIDSSVWTMKWTSSLRLLDCG